MCLISKVFDYTINKVINRDDTITTILYVNQRSLYESSNYIIILGDKYPSSLLLIRLSLT